MPPDLRLVIADDHPIFRRGLRQVLEAEPGLHVVAEASNGVDAIEAIRTLAPDVAVLDVAMPRMTGLDVAQEVSRAQLPTRLVFLTLHEQGAIFERAMTLGAGGYVLKDAALCEVVGAVRAVAAGRRFVSPALSEYLVERAFRMATTAPGGSTAVERLSPRERQVLRLIADGRTSKEIAAVLGVHYRTVENQRTAISQKLGLQGSHALVKFAFEHRAELS